MIANGAGGIKPSMTSGLIHRRLFAVLMAVAILAVGAPVLPARAATDCERMAMAVSMAMDMKSSPRPAPEKSNRPCNDGLNCLGAAGCAAPSAAQVSVTHSPAIATADANWPSRFGGPSVAHKPALPPPIARA